MAQTMTASVENPMTDGQIDTAVDQLRAALRKQRFTISKDIAQQVLGLDNLGMMMFAPFRQQVEMRSNMIVRRVKVDRSLVPQALLDATGRKQYTDRKVVDGMPRGEGEEVEVCVFKIDPSAYKNGWISEDDVAKQYEMRGLMPDPYAQGALNRDDPAFADDHPNGTQWKDSDGKWCFAAFSRWSGGRRVCVDRRDDDWLGDWGFVGVPVRK